MAETDSKSPSERYTPSPSQLLGGKYEVVSPVGRGGMASVWMGYTHGEAGFRRKVAIKRVLRHLHADEKFEAMFVEEARVVADLNHPNIVQVHDFGREPEGGYFIIMEWVEGVSLTDYVKAHDRGGKPSEWPLVAAICIEVLRALSAAHSRTEASGRPVPVIHRDVTPSNILVGVNGVIKLADFGLARATDRPRMTDPGIVKGKVAYLAPELLENAKPDPRCDVYSLGVVLWEALSGKRLFGGERTEIDTALRILHGSVAPVSEVRHDLPRELVAIVAQATARQPRDRFQRAIDMIEALSGLLRKQPAATDATAIARSVRTAKGWLQSQNPPSGSMQPPAGSVQPPASGLMPPLRSALPPPPPVPTGRPPRSEQPPGDAAAGTARPPASGKPAPETTQPIRESQFVSGDEIFASNHSDRGSGDELESDEPPASEASSRRPQPPPSGSKPPAGS